MRFFDLDLHRDLGTDRLSYRRLSVLISFMPREAATVRAMLGPEYAEWGVTDYLLAAAVDVLQGANWQRGGGKGQRPKPLTRPTHRLEAEAKAKDHETQEQRVKALREKRKQADSGER